MQSRHPQRHWRWFTGLAVFCALLAATDAVNASPRSPNIIFILADDMGYGDLACQNAKSKIPTPHLDRLAAEGMRFTDAHSPSSVCTPTRYAILTGRYCWRSRLTRGVLGPWGQPLIETDRLTVAALLKQRGYATACVGKWHLGWNWRTKDGDIVRGRRDANWEQIDFTQPIAGGPLAYGFDSYFGTAVPNYPPYCFIENDHTVGIPTDRKPPEMFGNAGGPMLPGWKLEKILPALADSAVAFIDKHAKQSPDQPFFLYFPLTGPHTPIAPTKAFQGKTQAGGYGDFMHQIDHHIGQLMVALRRNKFDDNTLIIFTSDNGSPCRDGTNMNGEKGSVRKLGHDPSNPWTGMKADVWEGGQRVPFIAHWPGRIKAGAVNDEPICHVDFMATVAALLEVKLDAGAGEDSYNLLPALLGKPYDRPLREAVVHHSISGMFAIRKGKWKLIAGTGSGGWTAPKGKVIDPQTGKGQLFDLAADPGEKRNRWDDQPEVVSELAALLARYRQDPRSRRRPLEDR